MPKAPSNLPNCHTRVSKRIYYSSKRAWAGGVAVMQRSYGKELDSILRQMVEVGAKVTVTPLVKPGKIKITCLKTRINRGKGKARSDRGRCYLVKQHSFVVTQMLSIQIPLRYGVRVDLEKGLVFCGNPDMGTCSVNSTFIQTPRNRKHFKGGGVHTASPMAE